MLIFVDSYQHYSTSYLAQKWDAVVGSFVQIQSVNRFSGQGLYVGDNSTVSKNVPANATYIVGQAIYWNDFSGGGHVLNFLEGSTLHTELVMGSTGILSARRNGTVLGSAASPLSTGNWYFVEVLVTTHDTAGVFIVRVNGNTVINLSSVDTRNGGSGVIDTVRLRASSGVNYSWYSNDLYIADDTGSAPTNTFLGDVRVECIFPNGNGNSSVMVGSDGNSTDNYLLVDETTPPNEDTDYVEGGSVGDKDTYAYGNLVATTGAVYGVQLVPRGKKDNVGARSFATVARLSGTEVDSSDFTLTSSYQYFKDLREAKPGGGAWSVSDVNSAEFGQKITV